MPLLTARCQSRLPTRPVCLRTPGPTSFSTPLHSVWDHFGDDALLDVIGTTFKLKLYYVSAVYLSNCSVFYKMWNETLWKAYLSYDGCQIKPIINCSASSEVLRTRREHSHYSNFEILLRSVYYSLYCVNSTDATLEVPKRVYKVALVVFDRCWRLKI
jgi:hypothetical protein